MGRARITEMSVEEREKRDKVNAKRREKYAALPKEKKDEHRAKCRAYRKRRNDVRIEEQDNKKHDNEEIKDNKEHDDEKIKDSVHSESNDDVDNERKDVKVKHDINENTYVEKSSSEPNYRIRVEERPNFVVGECSHFVDDEEDVHSNKDMEQICDTEDKYAKQKKASVERKRYAELPALKKEELKGKKRAYMKKYTMRTENVDVNVRNALSDDSSSVCYWKNKIAGMDIEKHHIAFHGFDWSKTCTICGAELLRSEDDAICCNHGKRMVARLPALPKKLELLYDVKGSSFLSRKMNRLFCFTGLGVTGQFMKLKVPSAVVIMGRTYHQVFPTSKPEQPLHWYIHDSSERSVVAGQQVVPLDWVMDVASVLDTVNPFSTSLNYMKDMHMETGVLTVNGFVDGSELAAIVHANNTVTINPRSAVLWLHNDDRPVYMSILSSLYEPLQYPLLFPHGVGGWSPDNPGHLSQIDWYRCRLMQEKRFLQLGRLSNEYLVDMYSRVEDERLNFLATGGYRKKPLTNDVDYAEDNDEQECNDNGARLPASFVGSKRWCSTQMADALALARAKGHPSFFITMTTNPNWLEIRSKLVGTQTAAEVPIIVVRSFHARLARLKALLRLHFSKIIYMIHVIEFQKRGLPHAHIVLKVEPEVPLELIDSIISAELPRSPDLLIKVEKYMVHQHSSRCQRNGKCCWDYPKPLNVNTYVDGKGYVQYRRRNINDLNIVPYSPFLLSQLDCHINVDVSATVRIFMYLYTYIYKGFDRVEYHIDISRDKPNDIDDYINARYLSAMEAGWRIMSYHVTSKEPAVKCLPVHLEDKRAHGYTNKLTASMLDRYFLRPKEIEFTDLTYIEYNEKYSFIPYRHNGQIVDGAYLEIEAPGITRNIVRRRHRSEIVCRIRLVLPHNGEVYYLRQILMHVAARSWGMLKTFNGEQFATYQETLTAMGLLENTKEHFMVMDEAISSLHTPGQLRFLFALLLIDGAPAVVMWECYEPVLIVDILEKMNYNTSIAEQVALSYIENILVQHGITGAELGLPGGMLHPDYALEELLKFSDVEKYEEAVIIAKRQMNSDQSHVYNHVCSDLDQRRSCIPLFIDGKAGTGKTFLLNAICLLIRSRTEIVLPCATTGLAALLYPGGRTTHSLFEIPVMDNNAGVHSLLERNSDKAKLISNARAIIWDEFPMANKAVIESVNVLLQEICNTQIAFGGKCFIAAGDFRQIAPVVKGSGRQATIDASIKSSRTWKSFKVLKLEKAIRNAGDMELVACVTRIGEDSLNRTVELSLFNTTNDFDEAVRFLFPIEILCSPLLCEKRAFLTPLNIYVHEFNKYILDILAGIEQRYFSYDRVTENEETISPDKLGGDEFLNNYTHSTLPPHTLSLKEGAICQLMKSLDREKGLVKNVRVIVEHIYNKFVTIRLLGALEADQTHVYPISRMNFYHQPDNCAFTIHRRQLPLRLAYSTTFHSCLGLTLDKVVLDLRTPVFAHGQLYTALTRIRRREDVLILQNELSSVVKTKNVVYQELLD